MNQSVSLVADIGGTNIRLGSVAADRKPTKIRSYRCADFPGLEAAIDQYQLDAEVASFDQAVVAVANPITGDKAELTNSDWEFSISAVKLRYQLSEFKVINDFTALALSLPLLAADELAELYVPATGEHPKQATKAVLGPGTGLGVSGLIYCELAMSAANSDAVAPEVESALWQPLQGEGGHVTIAPHNDREWAIVKTILTDADVTDHVSAERLLSGPGLVRLAQAIARLDQVSIDVDSPAEVVAKGIAGDCPVCAETLQVFCGQLGSLSADLALSLGAAGGVYIGGGVTPHLSDYLKTSDFVKRYLAKGRMEKLLRSMPVYMIQSENPALLGATQLIKP
ncbi:MAG: glucokinase [Gammaproteobacteria bacterium]|nr:glucokinase [Gammaproteobacteria bacterium]